MEWKIANYTIGYQQTGADVTYISERNTSNTANYPATITSNSNYDSDWPKENAFNGTGDGDSNVGWHSSTSYSAADPSYLQIEFDCNTPAPWEIAQSVTTYYLTRYNTSYYLHCDSNYPDAGDGIISSTSTSSGSYLIVEDRGDFIVLRCYQSGWFLASSTSGHVAVQAAEFSEYAQFTTENTSVSGTYKIKNVKTSRYLKHVGSGSQATLVSTSTVDCNWTFTEV
jgi:hypothetical protein